MMQAVVPPILPDFQIGTTAFDKVIVVYNFAVPNPYATSIFLGTAKSNT